MASNKLRFTDVSVADLEADANRVSLKLKKATGHEDEVNVEIQDSVILSATEHPFDNGFEWLINLLTPG